MAVSGIHIALRELYEIRAESILINIYLILLCSDLIRKLRVVALKEPQGFLKRAYRDLCHTASNRAASVKCYAGSVEKSLVKHIRIFVALLVRAANGKASELFEKP